MLPLNAESSHFSLHSSTVKSGGFHYCSICGVESFFLPPFCLHLHLRIDLSVKIHNHCSHRTKHSQYTYTATARILISLTKMLTLCFRKSSNSWLSTGWFTMVIALELCDRTNVFGMVPPEFCRYIQSPKPQNVCAFTFLIESFT